MSYSKSSRPIPSNLSVIEGIEQDGSHHLTGPFVPATPIGANTPVDGSYSLSRPGSPAALLTPTALKALARFSSESEGLWSDLKSMRWMRVPASSFKMILYPTVLYANYRFLQAWHLVPPDWYNPFEPLLFISHRVPDSSPEDPRYQKGYLDILFVLFYVIVWSFVRQSMTLYIFHPIARHVGIKRSSKLDRFGEQGYAITYFSLMSIIGLIVMSQTNTWWYKTENFWLEYPFWQMKPLMKSYYLLHSAYWLQQLLVLALRLEKPRKDFAELVVHHIVTLWLIGWSYTINFTPIGNAVFLSMDVSDVFLAFAKICNYLQLERTKNIAFAFFTCVWTYFRHWLNLVILWSVWVEFDLIPEHAKVWNPAEGVWFPYWMKYNVFVPLLALQFVNLFWYFLIWRILLRAVFVSKLDDERSDDEGETEAENTSSVKKGKNAANGSLRRSRSTAGRAAKDN
ncbi:longevity assurance proteins LAG1/LAC1 [Ramaria rubella]|nr:longevity assurance proteins LAG1/LAC1 [Ramaria rubella]